MTTAHYPALTLDSHDMPLCLLCGAVIVMHDDFDVCGACGSRRVRSQPKAAAADPYTCPVCFAGMDQPPEDHAICGGCGTHFGYDDSGRSHAELRALWIAHGRQWHYLRAAIEREKQAAAATPDTAQRLCPFCNCLAAVHTLRGIHPFTVACTGCGATAMPGNTEAEAWHAWNTRGGAVMFSRDVSLTAYVDDLLDLLQDVGGMSAAWCETKLETFEALLNHE